MNVADSLRVGSALERIGGLPAEKIEEADVIVLNTCVVRQSAEDKAYGRLSTLLPLKKRRPDLVINLMGCLVGVKGHDQLKKRFPYVDVFSPPSDPGPLLSFLTQAESLEFIQTQTETHFAAMDGDLVLPHAERGRLVATHVPVVLGCSHACTFCIIPYRRGVERSRSVGDIAAEVARIGPAGSQRSHIVGPDRRPLWERRPGWTRLAGLAAHDPPGGRAGTPPLPDLPSQLDERRAAGDRG